MYGVQILLMRFTGLGLKTTVDEGIFQFFEPFTPAM
jgi:hypothetical protein